jgi:peroxidase
MSRITCCALVALLNVLFVGLFYALPCAAEFRSFDGIGNNLDHPDWGAAQTNFDRLAPVDYADGISIARLADRPNPRAVANALFRQSAPHPNVRRLSGFVYAFGNLISHDSQETIAGTTELVEFRIPPGDDFFSPQSVPLTRSLFDANTGTGVDNPRQQVNFTTAFLDASAIYGSDEFTASVLRGGPANPAAKLRTSSDINGDGEDLLPRDAFGPRPDASFVAGDSRVNDNIILTAMHTLFMREHNRLVDELAPDHPQWSADELYQRARKIVGAEIQSITFNEFLPALLGPYAPSPTGHYDPTVNPAVLNEFPTVFLRVGHSMLPDAFLRIQDDGQPAAEGPLPLEEAFFDPTKLTTSAELDQFLKGLSVEVQEEVDAGFVDAMRIVLLDAIDVQRARDHGLPDYNTLRAAYGLARVSSVAEITSDVQLQTALAEVYPDVDTIDPFVGALTEDHLPGASVGPLVAAGFRTQFERLRDGDRFWYERDPDFTESEVDVLRSTRLSDIIRRNTGIIDLPNNVFFTVPEPPPFAIVCAAVVVAVIANRRRHGSRVTVCEEDPCPYSPCHARFQASYADGCSRGENTRLL